MTAPPPDDITATRIDALLDEIHALRLGIAVLEDTEESLRAALADRDMRIAMQEQAITELRGMLAIAGRTP